MMNKKIKILDCTLRDGGYIIDWMFGQKSISSIINNLSASNIDFIECGFLKNCSLNPNKTFFSSPRDLVPFLNTNSDYTLMINYGEYDIHQFCECFSKKIKIRVAFKKHNQTEALEYIKQLVELGWDVFVNPMSTNTYSNEELFLLIEKINKINPYGVSIVDTLGNMYEKQVIEIFVFIDKILNSEIALGFHSHNSMQLSFSNTKALLKMNFDRELIIDSCLYGMGRGAGNLCTELITKYLNDNFQTKYNILPLLKSIDKNLKPIYEKTPWGYSTSFYIAAINGCHPNYAGELVKQGYSDEDINKILSAIPEDKKLSFDKDLLTTLC